SRDWVRWHEQLPRHLDRRRAAAGPAAEPTISVCIAHYNRPDYLRQALRSIAEQDRAPLEVIVVDDGSPGEGVQAELGSIEQEFDFTGQGWRLVRQENRYLGAARNRAAAEATGDFLLFMEEGDIAKPQAIGIFAAVARYANADALTCLIDVSEGRSDPRFLQHADCRRLFAGATLPLSLLYNTFGDSGALVRRTAFLAVKGFSGELAPGQENWELFVGLTARGYQIAVIPEPLFWGRAQPGGAVMQTPAQGSFLRSWRPHLESLPAPYHTLIELTMGQSLERRVLPPVANEAVRRDLLLPPLRYRIVDALNMRVKRNRLVHQVAKRSVQGLLRVRRMTIQRLHVMRTTSRAVKS